MLGRPQRIRKAVARRVGDPWQTAAPPADPAPESGALTAEEVPDQVPAPDPAGEPPLAVLRRPGTYVMTTGDGTEVGVIQGDYVIGFTVRCFGRTRFIRTLDDAKAEVTRAWLLRRCAPEASRQQAS